MKPTLRTALLVPVLLIAAAILGPNAAFAQFEVKEVTVEKGEVEIEYQGDYHSGNPNRQFEVDGGEIEADSNDVLRQRHSLELGLGLTDRLKLSVGVEFEQERFDEPAGVSVVNDFDRLKASSLEAEATYVLIPLEGNGFGLAAFSSIEHAFESGEGNVTQVGPLMKVAQGPWSATANVLFTKNFGGDEPDENSDDRWDLDLAAQVAYEMNDRVTLAVEGYGYINRLGSSGSPGEFGDQDHYRIGPVVYYTFKRGAHEGGPMKLGKSGDDDGEEEEDDEGGITLGAGVLFGLNDDTADTTLKWSLAAEF